MDRIRVGPGPHSCEHLDAIHRRAEPRAEACEECGATAALRLCLSCGHVGCCDSKHGHARTHARETGHQVIRALPRGFTYCYAHREYL